MFEISRQPVHAEFVTIVDGYQDLLFTDQPILFTGFNSGDQRVIGSLAEQSIDGKVSRFFHAFVSETEFGDFIRRKNTYRELLEKVGSLFVIDQRFDGSNTQIYHIDFSDIPETYRPTADSYCPELHFEPALRFSAKLDGGLATQHGAEPSAISRVNKYVSEFLTQGYQVVKRINAKFAPPTPILRPATSGSYRVNFEITEFDEDDGLLPLGPQSLSGPVVDFANSYMQYALTALTFEGVEIFSNIDAHPKEFERLLDSFAVLMRNSNTDRKRLDRELRSQLLLTSKKLKSLSDTLGRSFTTISLLVEAREGEPTVGIIGEAFKQEIRDVVVAASRNRASSKISADSEWRQYSVMIYHLDLLTREGNAFVPKANAPDEFYQPKIMIEGDEDLAQSKYTRSLHQRKTITVLAKAVMQKNTKGNEKIAELRIKFEPS